MFGVGGMAQWIKFMLRKNVTSGVQTPRICIRAWGCQKPGSFLRAWDEGMERQEIPGASCLEESNWQTLGSARDPTSVIKWYRIKKDIQNGVVSPCTCSSL